MKCKGRQMNISKLIQTPKKTRTEDNIMYSACPTSSDGLRFD